MQLFLDQRLFNLGEGGAGLKRHSYDVESAHQDYFIRLGKAVPTLPKKYRIQGRQHK